MNNTTLIDLETPNTNIDYEEILFVFIVKGLFTAIVSILGICGNIITMIILSKPQMRSSINCILIGLARCDTVLLISALLIFAIPAINLYTDSFHYYTHTIYPFIAPIVYPIGLISQTGSVYLTITVTLERYIAVCHPLKARSICTYGRARVFVILIIIFSILYNAPRFLEVSRGTNYDNITNTTEYIIKASDLRENPYYITIYINWSYLVFMYVIPFLCLAVFNKAIYGQVRKANAERQRLSRLQKKEIGLATMLLCVVIVFFMCNILPLVNNILECFFSVINTQLVVTANLLVAINSSVNFIIYVIFGEKFKRLFLKMFCNRSYSYSKFCPGGTGGTDSPEMTHNDDSYVSNNGANNARTYSFHTSYRNHHRNSSLYTNNDRINRTRTVKLQLIPLNNRSNNNTGAGGGGGGSNTASTDVPCVYYPSPSIVNDEDK